MEGALRENVLSRYREIPRTSTSFQPDLGRIRDESAELIKEYLFTGPEAQIRSSIVE